MLLASFLRWWYGAGLKNRFQRLLNGLKKTFDFFSIDLLVLTLFQPFKMIDSEKLEKGALEDKLRNLFDRIIGRVIGMFIRLFVLFFGVIALILHSLWDLFAMMAWVITPFLPVLCLVLFILGVVPKWQM